MEKTKGKARLLHLPSHTAVRKHACQVRTQRELMRMGFQFKVFLCARCRRGVGPLLTGTLLSIVSLYPPRIGGGGTFQAFIQLSNWTWGSQGCHCDYTNLLFTTTRKKNPFHMSVTRMHTWPARHHQHAIFMIIHKKFLVHLSTLGTLHFQHDFWHCPREHWGRHSILSAGMGVGQGVGLLKAIEDSST